MQSSHPAFYFYICTCTYTLALFKTFSKDKDKEQIGKQYLKRDPNLSIYIHTNRNKHQYLVSSKIVYLPQSVFFGLAWNCHRLKNTQFSLLSNQETLEVHLYVPKTQQLTMLLLFIPYRVCDSFDLSTMNLFPQYPYRVIY